MFNSKQKQQNQQAQLIVNLRLTAIQAAKDAGYRPNQPGYWDAVSGVFQYLVNGTIPQQVAKAK